MSSMGKIAAVALTIGLLSLQGCADFAYINGKFVPVGELSSNGNKENNTNSKKDKNGNEAILVTQSPEPDPVESHDPYIENGGIVGDSDNPDDVPSPLPVTPSPTPIPTPIPTSTPAPIGQEKVIHTFNHLAQIDDNGDIISQKHLFEIYNVKRYMENWKRQGDPVYYWGTTLSNKYSEANKGTLVYRYSTPNGKTFKSAKIYLESNTYNHEPFRDGVGYGKFWLEVSPDKYNWKTIYTHDKPTTEPGSFKVLDSDLPKFALNTQTIYVRLNFQCTYAGVYANSQAFRANPWRTTPVYKFEGSY